MIGLLLYGLFWLLWRSGLGPLVLWGYLFLYAVENL